MSLGARVPEAQGCGGLHLAPPCKVTFEREGERESSVQIDECCLLRVRRGREDAEIGPDRSGRATTVVTRTRSESSPVIVVRCYCTSIDRASVRPRSRRRLVERRGERIARSRLSCALLAISTMRPRSLSNCSR